MSKREGVAVIGILVGLNIWLLFSVNAKNETIEELSILLEQQALNQPALDDFKSYRLVEEHMLRNAETYKLAIIFSDQGCQSCIEDEVAILNELHRSVPQFFDAYLITHRYSNYLSRLFGAKFEYHILDPETPIFDTEVPIVEPVAALIDSTGRVGRLHRAEIGNKEKSIQFYTQMERFLSNDLYNGDSHATDHTATAVE